MCAGLKNRKWSYFTITLPMTKLVVQKKGICPKRIFFVESAFPRLHIFFANFHNLRISQRHYFCDFFGGQKRGTRNNARWNGLQVCWLQICLEFAKGISHWFKFWISHGWKWGAAVWVTPPFPLVEPRSHNSQRYADVTAAAFLAGSPLRTREIGIYANVYMLWLCIWWWYMK